MYYIVFKGSKFVGYTTRKDFAKLYRKENANTKFIKIEDLGKIEQKYQILPCYGLMMTIEEYDYLDKILVYFMDDMFTHYEKLLQLVDMANLSTSDFTCVGRMSELFDDINNIRKYHSSDEGMNIPKIIRDLREGILVIEDNI